MPAALYMCRRQLSAALPKRRRSTMQRSHDQRRAGSGRAIQEQLLQMPQRGLSAGRDRDIIEPGQNARLADLRSHWRRHQRPWRGTWPPGAGRQVTMTADEPSDHAGQTNTARYVIGPRGEVQNVTASGEGPGGTGTRGCCEGPYGPVINHSFAQTTNHCWTDRRLTHGGILLRG
jgi:hypothetical protein